MEGCCCGLVLAGHFPGGASKYQESHVNRVSIKAVMLSTHGRRYKCIYHEG
jgi:hypothetical protein